MFILKWVYSIYNLTLFNLHIDQMTVFLNRTDLVTYNWIEAYVKQSFSVDYDKHLPRFGLEHIFCDVTNGW